jgi:hypothetical protein
MNSAKFVKNTSEIEKRLSSVKYDLYLHAMLSLCGIMLLLLVLNNNSNAYLLIAIVSFAKLSWQYLGDLIVKRKMEVYPEWYTMTTLNATLQTIGRPIRNANDYAITYVTDTSFVKVVDAMDLHTKARFKDEYYNGITTEFVNNTFNLNEYEQK